VFLQKGKESRQYKWRVQTCLTRIACNPEDDDTVDEIVVSLTERPASGENDFLVIK
jgi:hypothetical protein